MFRCSCGSSRQSTRSRSGPDSSRIRLDKSCSSQFGDKFWANLHLTNSVLFSPVGNAGRLGFGLLIGTGSAVASVGGTVTPIQALWIGAKGVPALLVGATPAGVANLTYGATLASGALTGVVSAGLSALALEGGIVIGSAMSAYVQMAAECGITPQTSFW